MYIRTSFVCSSLRVSSIRIYILIDGLLTNNSIILNRFGHTALTLAIEGSHSSVSVDKLIKAGANVNFMSGIVITPLYIAVIRRKIDIVKKLINAGADLNYFGSDPPPLSAAT